MRLPPLVLAHRGAWSAEVYGVPGRPQNSLEAIEAALALGADGVEIDVRRTSDGELVLAHDPLARHDGGRMDRGQRGTGAVPRRHGC
ncbi:MAG: glycerophosphodiester phosphodiesterase family protein [Acidimicrobiales bacterium]